MWILNGDPTCIYCLTKEETTEHILINCLFAKTAYEWIFNGAIYPHPSLHRYWRLWISWLYGANARKGGITSLTYAMERYGGFGRQGVIECLSTLVFLRNDKVTDNIKSQVFTYVKNRKRNFNYKWVQWAINPFIWL